MLQAAKAAGQLDNTRYLKKGPVVHHEEHGEISLKEAGISRDLSSRAQPIALVSREEFEKRISDAIEIGKLPRNQG
jgi:hypothetical protein